MADPIREITPLDCNMAHDATATYRYRGVDIVGAADGWDVYEADRPRDADYAEIGWGADMFEAMSVANEHVDGFERHKRAA